MEKESESVVRCTASAGLAMRTVKVCSVALFLTRPINIRSTVPLTLRGNASTRIHDRNKECAICQLHRRSLYPQYSAEGATRNTVRNKRPHN